MTPPIRSEPVGLTPPAATPPPPKAPHISPYYRNYLNSQAGAIRARLGDAGAGPAGDAAVQQFLEHDLGHPLSALPAVPLDALGNSEPDAPSNIRGVSMAVLQGATFGWGDEAVGSVYGALTGVGARAGREFYRAEYDAWAREHRATSIGAEIAGGLVTGGAFGAGKSILGTAARGAAAGAIAGAGTPNTDVADWSAVGERTKAAMIGAVTGGVFAGAAQGIGNFIAPVSKRVVRSITDSEGFEKVARATANTPVLQRLSNVTPEGRARETVFKYMEQAGVSVTELRRRVTGAHDRGEAATLVDILGDPFREFARDVFKDHNPAAQAIMQEFVGRQIKQGENLIGNLLINSLNNKKLGLENIETVGTKLHMWAQKASAPYYQSARSQVVKTTDELRELLSDPSVRTAWNRGAAHVNDKLKYGQESGLNVPLLPSKEEVTANEALRTKFLRVNPSGAEAGPDGIALVDKVFPKLSMVPDELPVNGIDYARRYMQEPVIQRYAEQARMGPLDPAVRRIRDSELAVVEAKYNVLRNEAMAQVPDYGKALQVYSGPHHSLDAWTAGNDAFRHKLSGTEVNAMMQKLNPSDQDFFRIGAMLHLQERMSNSTDKLEDFARSVFGGDGLIFDREGKKFIGRLNGDAARIVALFPGNPRGAEQAVRLIAGQANLSKSVGRAVSLPRSVSAEKVVQSEIGTMPPIRGNIMLNAASVVRQEQANAVSQLSVPEKKALAELLGQGLRDPAEITTLLDRFEYHQWMNKRPLKIAARAKSAVVQKVARSSAGIF